MGLGQQAKNAATHVKEGAVDAAETVKHGGQNQKKGAPEHDGVRLFQCRRTPALALRELKGFRMIVAVSSHLSSFEWGPVIKRTRVRLACAFNQASLYVTGPRACLMLNELCRRRRLTRRLQRTLPGTRCVHTIFTKLLDEPALFAF